jgi:hypothetical protein
MSERVVLLKCVAAAAPPSNVAATWPGRLVGATEVEEYFVRTVQDLDDASESDDPYTVLRASGVLRLLLLDGLFHKASVRLNRKIRFTVDDFNMELPPGVPVPEIHWQLLSPVGVGARQRIEVNLDKFLAAPMLRTPDATASVRDVIQACANAMGGIHFGEARTVREQAVIQLDKVQVVFGSKPSVQSLKDICRIAVLAFQPFVLAIQAS